MKSIVKSTLLCCMGAVFAATTATGAFIFTNGDLILGFQATGGTGATKNVFVNLGAGTYHRDNPGDLDNPTAGNNPFGTSGQTSIGNVGATLTLVYGANWYSRSDLYVGVVGNLNPNPNSGVGNRPAVNGDPSRTVYLSTPADSIGGGVLYAGGTFTPTDLGIGANNLTGLESFLPILNTEADGAAILDLATKPVEWNNSWTAWNPTPGAAFGVFTGGIQQNFGESDNLTMVDLQRLVSTNTDASPTGVIGGGTYETTIAISSNGTISSIPEPTATLLGGLGMLALFRRRRA